MADDIRLVIGVDDRDLIKAQKEQKKFERNILTIEAAFRRGDITAGRYTAELNKQAKQLSRLGGTYVKANSEVRSYASSIRKVTNDQLAMAQATNMAGRSTNRFGMYAQQVGYQVGDFFVQVQSGTSALVAFGQQGTQLAGLLPGLAGAVVGISLAVGTMLLRTLLQAREAVDSTSTGFVDFKAALKSARSATKELTQDIALLKGGFEDLNEAVLSNNLKKAEDYLKALKLAATLVNGPTGGKRTLEKENAQTAIDLAQKELDLYLKQRAEKEKLVSLERARLGGISLFYEYQQRDLQIVKDRAAAVKKIAEKEVEGAKKATEEYNKQWSKLSDKIYLLEVEKQYGASAIIFLTEQSRLSQAAYQSQLEASGMAEDQVASLVSLNKEMEDFNLKLAASTLDSERLARNLATAASFNTGGVGGEFANVATGLDAFGGKGDYRYDKSSKVKIEKKLKANKPTIDPLVQFQTQLDLEDKLLNVSEARQKVLQALGSDVVAKNPEIVAGMEAQITETNKLIALEEKRQGLIDSVTGSIENGMMAMIDGTMSVKDAFKSMAAEIIKELYRVLVVQQMVNAAKGFFGFADGGAFSGGSQVQAYANGGVVSGPTTFPMSGGKTGLMGEAGPEAIMPLKRGSNGKLGVQMEGGGGGDNIVINQSFNFQANGDDTVKKLIAQAAPKIADMAKASVIESRRRGGSTKAAFG